VINNTLKSVLPCTILYKVLGGYKTDKLEAIKIKENTAKTVFSIFLKNIADLPL
jgi:hypothetical protein